MRHMAWAPTGRTGVSVPAERDPGDYEARHDLSPRSLMQARKIVFYNTYYKDFMRAAGGQLITTTKG